MAPTPLIDLDHTAFHAAEVQAGEDVRALLKQRGSFALLDGILHFDADDPVIVGYHDVRADAWWAPDHIPGRPLFPGVLMIEGGAQLCSYDFQRRRRGAEDSFVGFGGVDKARFRGTVVPGCRMVYVAREKRVRSRMFTYEVQGFVDRTMVFEAEILGVIL